MTDSAELVFKNITKVLERGDSNMKSFLNMKFRLDNFFWTIFYKRDAFDFDIVNFPDLSGNIPTAPAYGTYFAQLVR